MANYIHKEVGFGEWYQRSFLEEDTDLLANLMPIFSLITPRGTTQLIAG